MMQPKLRTTAKRVRNPAAILATIVTLIRSASQPIQPMKHFATKNRLVSSFVVALGLALLVFAISAERLRSATPAASTLNPTGPNVPWVGAPGVLPGSLDESTCVEGQNCDTFLLTLSGNPADWTGKKAHVVVSWADANDDFDVFIHKGSTNTGAIVGSSAQSGAGPETVDIDPNAPGVGTGQFSVHVVYFLVTPTHNYNGVASAVAGAPTPTPSPTPGITPTPTPAAPGRPRYFTSAAPPGTGENAGEPSIGSNWLSENVVRAGSGHTFANSNGAIPNGGTTTYYGGFLAEMLRITFDDCSSPADAYWEKKPLVLAATPRALGDPILFTDHGYPGNVGTGRTFVSQEEVQAGSTTDKTDNDGDTFEPTVGAGAPAGVDHQTVAAGPFHLPVPPTATYPRAVYYASQSVSDARTSRSDDGGITFGPAIPMYTTADCGGLHGHIKVGPDGTVYVPNNACGGTDPIGHADGQQAAIVSEDNGVTWSIRPIPGSDTKSDRDPSIGIATDGTVYMGMQSNDGHARISVTHNKGLTWSAPSDVGAQLGIQNIVFPAVVAGDPNRAAFAFYGTTTGGNDYDQPTFPGVWYLYIASTFDGGVTWDTQNVTPGDPIQRGGICGADPCRNLLDFFDATIDKQGRVLIGWDDGCVGGCVNGGNNSFTAKATITRQSGGKRMFAAFDPVEPAFPGAPAITGSVNGANTAIQLSWPAPDNGGSFITAYKIYRRAGPTGPFTLIATVNVPNYTDTTFNSAVQNFYHVTAVNTVGEGPYCKDFLATAGPTQSACVLPGILVINDLNPNGSDNDSGQNTPVDGSVNVKQVYVAEPYSNDGAEVLHFTSQVAPSTTGSAPPNSQWYMIWNRQGTPGSADPGDPNDASFDRMYVAMRTDASGAPAFEYGKFGIPINTSPPPLPDPNANSPVKYGNADSGSYDPLTGVIRIRLAKSKLRTIDGGATKYNAGSDLAALNARTYFNRPDPGQRSQNNASDITSNGTYSIVSNASCAPVAQLVSAVSRKVHGTAGTFDIRLVPTGPDDGIECRSGGVNGAYQVVMVLASPVTFSSATTSAGSVASTSTNANIVTVNLTGVPNAQTVTVTLVNATSGGAPTNITVPMNVLLGDTTANRAVNSSDVSEAKAKSGDVTDAENFRDDVTANGVINSSDVSLIKSKSGTSLPPAASSQQQPSEKK